MASDKLRKSWLLHIGSTHSLSKIPRKVSVIKKKSIFQPIIFFPLVEFSGAGVWNWEHINRPNRGHTPVELPAGPRASPDNTVRPDQSNRLSPNRQPPVSRPYMSSACLFYLFNKQNKLNLLVSLIFLATTRLYITYIIMKEWQYLFIKIYTSCLFTKELKHYRCDRDRDEGLGHRTDILDTISS